MASFYIVIIIIIIVVVVVVGILEVTRYLYVRSCRMCSGKSGVGAS